jgi:type IV pilus assembly protein PilY1
VVSGGAITGSLGGWSGSNLYADPPLWSASIPAVRNIFTASPMVTATSPATLQAGIPFEWASLNVDNNGNPDPSPITEPAVTAARGNPLGDIVGSQLVYVGKPVSPYPNPSADFTAYASAVSGRTGAVYIGANDGMLHGFDAGQGAPGSGTQGSGAELLAYVPRGLLGTLQGAFGTPGAYAHKYGVNSGMFSADAQLGVATYGVSGSNPGQWATVLAGALGAGGPGYFVLDVTDPTQLKEANTAALGKAVLIDATDVSSASPLAQTAVVNGDNAVLKGATGGALQTIGYQFAPPVMQMYSVNQSAQIVQINSKNAPEWAVIIGNGYNSASGAPTLLIQSLSQKDAHGNLKLYAVAAPYYPNNGVQSTWKKDGNGLGAPRPVDVDGNGTADVVYAGDLEGNLWKFDISSPDPSQWHVAYSGKPVFTAVGPLGKAQAITTAPATVPNSGGGYMVAFGTGRNLISDDSADDATLDNENSFYVLYDNEKLSASMQALDASAPNTQASVVTLAESDATPTNPTPFCAATGGGSTRYAACLYEQTDGTLSDDPNLSGLSSGVTGTPATALKIGDGSPTSGTVRGWYYDIPDYANGNFGKVLANPEVLSGNTVLFYSQNVADNGGSGSSAESYSAPSGAVTTLSYFNIFTGLPPNNVYVTLGNAAYTYTGQRNRFQIGAVSNYVHNGLDGVRALGQDGLITLGPANPPGRNAGWHLGR